MLKGLVSIPALKNSPPGIERGRAEGVAAVKMKISKANGECVLLVTKGCKTLDGRAFLGSGVRHCV